MVSAIGTNTGIITCGIFGSVMWWPEAELRSSVEGAGIRLPSETRARSVLSGSESPRAAMSKVLHRYFTPSSAALAEATLQRMHSSGDLQGSKEPTLVVDSTILDDSVDLDEVARYVVQPSVSEPASPQARAPEVAPQPAAAPVAVEQAPPPEAAPAASEQAPPPEPAPAAAEQAAARNGSEHSSSSSKRSLINVPVTSLLCCLVWSYRTHKFLGPAVVGLHDDIACCVHVQLKQQLLLHALFLQHALVSHRLSLDCCGIFT